MPIIRENKAFLINKVWQGGERAIRGGEWRREVGEVGRVDGAMVGGIKAAMSGMEVMRGGLRRQECCRPCGLRRKRPYHPQ